MLRRFLPRQEGFFHLFQKTADILVKATTEFHTMLLSLENQQAHVDAIASYEHEADQVAHTTFECLHKTFITPFDRHDIHQLTSGLDDILDLINRCAQRFPFYHLKKVPDEMITLAKISVECGVMMKEILYRLHSLKNPTEILKRCEDIDALESEAHLVVLAGEKVLFIEEKDFKHFFMLKEIYTSTKSVINCFQDASNIIKGIVLEYS